MSVSEKYERIKGSGLKACKRCWGSCEGVGAEGLATSTKSDVL